eukprot:6650054-Pyramimonas_sp.AAC.1
MHKAQTEPERGQPWAVPEETRKRGGRRAALQREWARAPVHGAAVAMLKIQPGHDGGRALCGG